MTARGQGGRTGGGVRELRFKLMLGYRASAIVLGGEKRCRSKDEAALTCRREPSRTPSLSGARRTLRAPKPTTGTRPELCAGGTCRRSPNSAPSVASQRTTAKALAEGRANPGGASSMPEHMLALRINRIKRRLATPTGKPSPCNGRPSPTAQPIGYAVSAWDRAITLIDTASCPEICEPDRENAGAAARNPV